MGEEMKYIIQVRKVITTRQPTTEEIMGKDEKLWQNYDSRDSYETAELRAMQLIENTSYKANEVRIVKVVATFKSDIAVMTEREEEDK